MNVESLRNEAGELQSLLAAVRRRWFALVLMNTGARAAMAAAVPLFAVALAGWLLGPSTWTLVAIAALGALAALVAAGIVLMRVERRPDDRRVARFIEEQAPAGGLSEGSCEPDALVSAVQVADGGDEPPAFGALVVTRALAILRRVDPATVVPAAALRRAVGHAGAAGLILALALAASGPYLLRAGATIWAYAFPGSIGIAVLTGDVRVPAGQRLRIAARIEGRAAQLLPVAPSLVVSAGGQERTVPMAASPEGFSYVFESIDRTFEYTVVAGGARSSSYTVTALFPPRVKRIEAHYEYPRFTGLRARQEEDAGDIYGPAGTKVRLQIHADKPLAAASLALSSGSSIALQAAQDNVAAAELVVSEDDGYRVKLTDTDGLVGQGDVEYFIRVMDDRPPDVRIVRPAADRGITPLEEVLIEARADDDYGVAGMELVYAVAGREPRTVRLPRLSGTPVARVGSYLLAAEELDVQPGDVITYYARARDVARGKPSTVSRSDMFFLEVQPFNEEFVSAASQAMGGGAAGMQIDALIAAQKEIISGTWNLERRSGAGRSAEDVKALSEAQAELKARAERMMSGRRRGVPGYYPPQQIDRQTARGRAYQGADPVSAAVAAMSRAIERLQEQRTADAIPHEMSALQALLQAQAEIRRRQVMRQSASNAGQGGTSRTDRDLSALFDRELQRQQRTNYETPPQSGNSGEQQDASDALDRIRDLARRQEEIARRQRSLPERTPEEAKRELERLTRDQQELQRQAEEIEKQLGQAANRAGGASGRKRDSARERNARDLRQASEQMRQAAREMEQQNAAAAAARGEKAAESLQRLERQILGGTSDARQRAAGELQLEAQQIAERQRRIANEVSRLEKSGNSANGDALRRLAAEKEELADRVERLERTAEQLGKEMPGEPGKTLGQAARRLQEQQVSERMRAAAGQMRDAARASGTPEPQQRPERAPGTRGDVEQQLSRALDSVARALGGESQADAQRLSDELDRTREMRDRLRQLERQVREAESRAKAARQQGSEGDRASADAEAQRARQAYGRELQEARDSLGRTTDRRRGLDGATPEEHQYSRSAPGNEAFKQDFSNWERLGRDVELAMERHEAAVTAKLAAKIAEDRLNAGGSERVPDEYRDVVSRYFEALARPKP